MSENKYVKKISDVERGRILQNSVAALSAKPTLNATEMKMRFVKPIIDTDKDAPSIAKEIDRIADETDAALQVQEKTMDSIDNNVISIGSKVLEIESDLGGVQRKVSSMEAEINKAEDDIFQLQVGFGAVSAVGSAIQDLEGKVAYAKASKIEVSVNPHTFVTTFKLLGDGGVVISMDEIDLPLESVVVGGKFDESTKNVVLTLQNGSAVSFSVADLVDGLISSSEKGATNGVASLDENGKVPKEQLPDGIGSGGGVSEERVEELIDEKIGNIESVLDSVIAIQTSLIGGNS